MLGKKESRCPVRVRLSVKRTYFAFFAVLVVFAAAFVVLATGLASALTSALTSGLASAFTSALAFSFAAGFAVFAAHFAAWQQNGCQQHRQKASRPSFPFFHGHFIRLPFSIRFV